jgi:hypothetical protein
MRFHKWWRAAMRNSYSQPHTRRESSNGHNLTEQQAPAQVRLTWNERDLPNCATSSCLHLSQLIQGRAPASTQSSSFISVMHSIARIFETAWLQQQVRN